MRRPPAGDLLEAGARASLLSFGVGLFGLVVLAVFGWFRSEFVVLAIGISVFAGVIHLVRSWQGDHPAASRGGLIVAAVLVLVAVVNGALHHGVPIGRDNMGYLSAAVKLTDTGSLKFYDPLSTAYSPYREIENDVYTSQFLPGYIAWLGAHNVVGGVPLALGGNTLLVLLTLISLFLLGREFSGDRRAGVITITLFMTSYATLWFTRRTNSENLFMALIWGGAWLFIDGVRKRRLGSLGLGFFLYALLPIVRPEGLAYTAAFLIATVVALVRMKVSEFGSYLGYSIGAIAAIAAVAVSRAYDAMYGGTYYEYAVKIAGNLLTFLYRNHVLTGIIVVGMMMTGAAWLYRWKLRDRIHVRRFAVLALGAVGFLLGLGLIASRVWLSSVQQVDWSQYKAQYVLENFAYYMLIPIAIIGIVGLFRRGFPRIFFVVPILILPAFAFLIDPSIAVDQPWFMRRYYATVIPFLALAAGVALVRILTRRRSVLIVAALLVVLNLSVVWPVLTFREYRGIEPQLQAFAQRFSEDDLILMEPGWDWQQWAYALHYLYGANVLPRLGDFDTDGLTALMSKYKNVYILDHTASRRIYDEYPFGDRLERVGSWSFAYPALIPTSWLAGYVDEYKRGLDLQKIRTAQAGTPPRMTEQKRHSFAIYRVR